MYLVESAGKLLMVKRWVRRPFTPCTPDGRRTFRLEVWEADLSQRRWNKLDASLQGQALFVSRPCSKSLPAGHGVREDCIYFLNNIAAEENYLHIFNLEKGTEEVQRPFRHKNGCLLPPPRPPMWLLPTDD